MSDIPTHEGAPAPLRIAIFTDSFFPELGGIQDSIMASARELGRRGVAVLILAPAASPRDFSRAGLAVAELEMGENVTIHRLSALAAPGSTGQSRLALPWARTAGVLAAFRPDVIHTQTFLGAGLAARAAARHTGVPLLGTNHWAVSGFSLYAPLAPEAVTRVACRAVARFYNHCAWTSVPSRAALAEMRAHGFRGTAAVISNPIDTERFHPASPEERARLKQELGLSSASVVYAGRLAREKHVDVLIRALPVLRARLPQAMLVLAGRGTARVGLEALARELGVADAVRFTGMLDHAALARLFQAADAFALASTSESQGMALLQAMSTGLPVVAVRQGPLVEYVPPGTGALTTPGDAAEIAACLAALLLDPRVRQRAGEAASRWAAQFGVAPVTDMMQAAYARAVSRSISQTPDTEWSKSCA